MDNLQILQPQILKRYKKVGRPGLRVAIVGNSGVSREDDSFIANADCVIRFNNYATRAGIAHTKDKNKCDILFTTFDLHSSGCRPKDVVIGIPYPFKAEHIIDKPRRWYPRSEIWMVNPYENMNLCKEIGLNSQGFAHPLPSIGFTALWHMRKWDASFYVTGFSWYYNEETGKFQNWDLRNKNYPKTWNHNYPVEVEWVIKNLSNKNNFIFSGKCKRILNIAKEKLK